MKVKYPLRSKRKAQTRVKILRAAQAVFYAKGYDDSTLDEIAEAAGVHVQTLYRHFATKQELASAGDRRWFELFNEWVETRDPRETAFDTWRAWLRSTYGRLISDGGAAYREYMHTRHANPSILGELSKIRAQYEDILCELLARDFSLPAEGTGKPRLVAGMLLAGSAYVMRRFDAENIDLIKEAVAVVDEVEAMCKEFIIAQPVESAQKAS